jgi:hypothetical protein
MKKKVYVSVFVAVALLVVAAAVIFIRRGHVSTDSETGVLLDINSDSSSENAAQSYWNPDNHAIAKGHNGYYYMSDAGTPIVRLMYFDSATQESVVLCAKPECTHTDKTCNAYIIDNSQQNVEGYLTDTIYYYNDYIYVIKIEAGMGKLVRINPDGSERKVIGDLFANSNVSSISLVFDGNYAYAYDDTGHVGQSQEAEETIKKISLDTGTGETVFTYSGVSAAIIRGRSFGGKMYFIIREYELDKTTMVQKMDYKGLYEYDYSTGDTRKVIDENICDYYIDSDIQCIYYFVDGEGLYKYTQSNGSSMIYAAHEKLVSCRMSFDGQYIYLYNVSMGSTTNAMARVKPACYILDKDGNEVNSIECSGTVYFGDEHYFFAGSGNEIQFIDKSDIENAKEWTKID